MLLGVDVGGTFTDAVLFEAGKLRSAKKPTTPHDPSVGVLEAVEAVLGGSDATVERFAHGTTAGTNALLERRGAETALIATRGFSDLLEIARQDRPSLYRLDQDRPPPLAPPELRVSARERIGPAGVVEALEDEEIERIASEIERLEPEAVAICLLFSYLDPSHERRIAAAIRKRLPALHVSASAQVLPRMREYERASTTVIDAYLAPLLAKYLSRLSSGAERAGLPEPVVISSSGGVLGIDQAGRGGAWSVLSGPAGGAVGAGLLASLSGNGNALGFDMGGTSCDVCVIEGGRVRRTDERELAGRPIQLPMVDVHTVGAGGGSIGWRDPGGALRVGPRSAGADPGPAAYGRGSSEPTTTDANLLLGRLGDETKLADGIELSRDLAEAAVGRLAGELELTVLETAEGMLRVADQEMIGALRVVTVERGVDPREFALLPFGGAGGLHAVAIAEDLGIETILCPRAGGVLSALGLIAAGERRELARTVILSGDQLNRGRLDAEIETLIAALGGTGGEIEAGYGLRYRGQSFELPVAGPIDAEPDWLRARFAAAHEQRYGYSDPESEIELATIGIARVEAGPDVIPAAAEGHRLEQLRRPAFLDGEWVDVPVFRGEPVAGAELSGPCIAELPESTLLLTAAWSSRVDRHGTIVATRGKQ